jgi:hypothetical protein
MSDYVSLSHHITAQHITAHPVAQPFFWQSLVILGWVILGYTYFLGGD